MIIEKKRNNIILFIITVVILATNIGIVSNIIFNFINENYRQFIPFIFLILLFFCIIAFIFLLRRETVLQKIKFPFVFNVNKKKFVDINCCPTSVHARYLFDHFSEEERKNFFKTYVKANEYKSIKAARLYQFFNFTVIEIILSIVIRDLDIGSGYKTVSYSDIFKDSSYKYFYKNCLKTKGQITIPKWLNISLQDKKLLLMSKYGNITFQWTVQFRYGNYDVRPYLSLSNLNTKNKFYEIFINLFIEYDYNFLMVFSKKIIEFERFKNKIEDDYMNYDWKNVESKLLLMIFEKYKNLIKI